MRIWISCDILRMPQNVGILRMPQNATECWHSKNATECHRMPQNASSTLLTWNSFKREKLSVSHPNKLHNCVYLTTWKINRGFYCVNAEENTGCAFGFPVTSSECHRMPQVLYSLETASSFKREKFSVSHQTTGQP